MTLQQFLDTLQNHNLLRIIEDDKDVYVGYLALFIEDKVMYEQYSGQQMKRFKAVPEIKHKRWKELNLMPPLSPEETPDYSFSDLQIKLYYTIYL